jgi:mannose-6-phosphate isomerase-like protein (cupin superfamily)
MHRSTLLAGAALLALSGAAMAQQDVATDITNAQIEKVLKEQPKATDHTLRVLDMGSYQLSVAVVYRGPSRPAGARRAGPPPGEAQATPCGVTSLPAGSKPPAPGGISHDDTVETYIVTKGSGTLVTGGQIMNGRRSGPDSEVTKILNGPSCSGQIVGDYVARKVVVGDISVIPAGVAHGWMDIPEGGVTYLSVRPDPKKVLQHGYVNPALK